MNLLSRLIRRDKSASNTKPQTALQVLPVPSHRAKDGDKNHSESLVPEDPKEREIYYTSSTLVQAGKHVFSETEGVMSLTVMDWKNHISSMPVQSGVNKSAKDRSVATALVCHSLLRYLSSLSSAPFLREIVISTDQSCNLIMPLMSDQFVTEDGNYWLLNLELDPVQSNLPMVRQRVNWWADNLN